EVAEPREREARRHERVVERRVGAHDPRRVETGAVERLAARQPPGVVEDLGVGVVPRVPRLQDERSPEQDRGEGNGWHQPSRAGFQGNGVLEWHPPHRTRRPRIMMAGVKGWSRVRWLLVAGLVAAAGIATAALSRGERTAVGVVEVRRAPLVVPVLCLGTLEPPPGGVLQAPAAAIVAAVLVAEGARVEKGTALVRLDDPDLAARAAAARAELQQAREASAVAEAERDGARREPAA